MVAFLSFIKSSILVLTTAKQREAFPLIIMFILICNLQQRQYGPQQIFSMKSSPAEQGLC